MIVENKKGINYMKNTFYYVFNNDAYPQYPIEIPENVAGLEIIEKTNGIFLQYMTESDKKREWAFKIMGKNFRNLECSYFNKELGVSFVLLSDGRFGFSRCSKYDKFNTLVGRAVAICHAMGEKIPDFI